MAWRVEREAVLLLGGPRALLLQLAHPLVAAGVGAHSEFLLDPLGRLRRTLDLTLGIVFGDRSHAEACAARLHQVHSRVQGVLSEGTSAFPAGTRYTALDPPLLLWVHATLIDTSFVTYRRFVGRLSLEERQRFYQESKLMARLAGVPEERIPADLRAFRRYLRATLRGSELEVTPTAQRLARAVLHPPRPLPLRLFSGFSTIVAAGLLPARVRAQYGLAWGPQERRAFRWAQGLVRGALPWTPPRARFWKQARRARVRLQAAGL